MDRCEKKNSLVHRGNSSAGSIEIINIVVAIFITVGRYSRNMNGRTPGTRDQIMHDMQTYLLSYKLWRFPQVSIIESWYYEKYFRVGN